MKKILFLTSLLASILLTSCGAQKTTLLSSRSIVLDDPVITQLPVVVELTVEPVAVSIDTIWRNNWFSLKKHTTKKEQEKLLIGMILQKYNADVLVQPKIEYDKTLTWTYEEHKLTVTGFPARYTNFHTPTQEEWKLVKGKKGTSIEGPSVVNIYNSGSSNNSQHKTNVMPIREMDNRLE